ncbi:MAG: sodium:proton antiporter [Clostridiales Family XIII bacterium]|jgi:Na+/H+ antiporter NhaC|nr:sodium:proton antiporter [Clostridiales Family XIII bacterium]
MESDYGALSLVPAIVIIVFALITRKSFSSLMIGAVLAWIVMFGVGAYGKIMDMVYGVVMDGDVQWTILLTGIYGALIFLLRASGGIDSFTNIVGRFATTAKRTMIGAWIVGLLIFIGDMLNIMAVGVTMMKLSDKHKVPREMLAYIMDSTAAPVAVLAPVSSWAAFFITVFMGQPEVSFDSASKVANYATLVPMLFYPMATVLCVLLLSIGVLPKIGAMKKAWERVASTGMIYSERSAQYNKELESAEPGKEKPKRIINFALPILVLLYCAIGQGDILMGSIFSTLTIIILVLAQRICTFGEVAQLCMDGFVSMMPMIIIVVGAFMARDSLVAIGLPAFVINSLEPVMSPALLPAITFAATATLSFVTSSSWGVPAVVVPIVVPLAAAVGAPIPLTLAAIVSAASFGSHACFYSDATVITSAIAKIENTEHAFSQFPYALMAAAVAFVAYLIGGFALA